MGSVAHIKRFARLPLIALVAITFLCGCGKKSETVSPITRAAMPATHSLDFDSGFVADDLTHGLGAAQLIINRRWSGSDTLNTHLGMGWSDQNVMQLTLVSRNVVLIWRGGIGWLTAHRKGEKLFEGNDGEKIEQTDRGWTAQMPHGLTLTFDMRGRLISKKPATGPACNYSYDKNGRLISLGTGADNELKYRYDKQGRVTRVDGPEGLRVVYSYDKDRLAAVENSRKVRFEYRYADDGKLISAKDQFGNELELAKIGPVKRPVARAPAKLDALPQPPKYDFDAQGRVTATAEGAASKSYEYDDAGRTSAISGPEGKASCKYDAFGRIMTVQNPDGTSIRFEYNNLDLPTLISKPDGRTQKFSYDEHGRLLRRERSPTDWEEFSYDSAGRIEMRRTPPAAEEHYVYGDGERIARVKYSSGREVSFEYDPAGRVLSESQSSGEKRMWRYDAEGRLAESLSATGLKTTYHYDSHGELVGTEDSVHGPTSYHRVQSSDVVESAGGKTIRTLTEWGKPLEIIEPGGARTLFNYGNRGLLETVLSPMNMPWRYEYSPARKLTAIIGPSGARTSTTWDAAGRRTKIARGNIAWREYHYNAAGRVEQEYSGTGRAARYGYGRDGQLTEVELPDGKVVSTTDKNGLRLSRKASGYEIEDRYNGDGTLLARKYKPAGLEVKVPLDAAGRAAGIEVNNLKATYAYDTRGELAQINLPGGTAIKVTTDDAARPVEFTFGNTLIEKISYDRADRMTAIETKQTSGKNVFSEHYAYDAAGNLSQRTIDSGFPTKFEYDRESRLTHGSGRNVERIFTYDVDGNLTTNGEGARCQIDNLGRPIQQGATSYSWDAGGNLTQVQNAKGKIDNVFDDAGRLVERRDGKNTWKFGYDSEHDRLWKESSSGKRWYAYLDDRLGGFKDEAGTIWLIVAIPGTDRPLALCGSNGQTLFILHDRLGSARRFVDSSGAVVARDDYSAFGNLLTSSGTKPIGIYAGMMQDETGLFYARRRYYDPAIARFISVDPLIGTPGIPSSHNAYAYAANNPLRYRDPMGTDFASEVAAPDSNLFHCLSESQQAAVKEAYDGAERASRVLNSPMQSTPAEMAAASQHLQECNAALARMNEIARAQYKYVLLATGPTDELSAVGKANAARNTAEAKAALEALGEMPQVGRVNLGINAENLGSTLQNIPQVPERVAIPAERALVPTGGTAVEGAAGSGQSTGGVGDQSIGGESGVHDPGIMKDGSIRDIEMQKNASGGFEKKPSTAGPGDASHLADAEEMYQAGRAAKGPIPRDAEMVYNAENGMFRVVSKSGQAASFAAEEAAARRWLGPKVLQAGGKVLRAAGPLLEGMAVVDTAMFAGWMAKGFMDNLNQPFVLAQKEKQGARWLGERLANELRQLAAADPDQVITGDGHKFDPNNPKDIEQLMLGLSQNLFFGAGGRRQPFDGLLKKITTRATSFMSAAEGDTSASWTLDNARKLMQNAIALEKAAGEAAKECIREQTEAQSQLQNVMTLAGGRAVAESDLATLPETANDVKSQTAKVEAQTKALQAASDTITAAVAACDAASTKICDWAQRSASATPEEAAKWKADATSELFAASNGLNTAQATVDAADLAVAELRKSIAVLEGSRSALTIYKMGSGAAEGGGIKPDAAFTAAKAAAERASAARDTVGPMLAQLSKLGSQIANMLDPYLSTDAEAAALAASALDLGSAIQTPSLVDFGALITLASPLVDAALKNQDTVEKAIGKIDIDKLVTPANAAIAEAVSARSESALATGPERYRSLQTANQCLAAIGVGPADKTAEAAPTSTPAEIAGSPNAASGEEDLVSVPSIGGAESVEYAGTILRQAGFNPVFNAIPPQNKKQELTFAGQNPKPGEKKPRGSVVNVYVYQKYAEAEASATPIELAAASPTESLSPPEMAESSPAGSSAPTAPPLGPSKTGSMPNLIGLTLDQATTRLSSNMSIGGDEIGSKPPTPEKALTIYAQSPAAGEKVSTDKNVVVTVKRYGSAKTAPEPTTEETATDVASGGGSGDFTGFEGTWVPKGASASKSVYKIYRGSSGYAADGMGLEDKPGHQMTLEKGVVQSGRLIFNFEIDARDLVGMFEKAEKLGNNEDNIWKFVYTLTPKGDDLQLDFHTESKGKIDPGSEHQALLERRK